MPTHASAKCSHEENRKKVCGPCGQKITVGKKKLNHFNITETNYKLIRDLTDESYDLHNERYPLSICSSCRKTLSEHNQGVKNRTIRNMPNYADIVLPKVTRSESNLDCECYICRTAQSTKHCKNTLLPTQKKHLNNHIDKSNGLYGSSIPKVSQSEGSVVKKQVNKSVNNVIKLCGKCLQQIGNGFYHSCETRDYNVRKNVMQVVNKLTDKQKGHVASSVLQALSSKESAKDSIKLSTEGRKKTVYLKESQANKKMAFTADDLDDFQANTSVSTRHMRKMTSFIRKTAGRKSVPVKYEDHIKERSHLLDTFYEESLLEFEIKDGKREKRPVVWANASKLLKEVIEKRNLIGSYVVKVMADGGQGFFKVSMSIIPDSISSNNEDSDGIPLKKKKLNVESQFKATSVKKLIMICIVPDIKESYENVKQLFDLVKLNDISFKFVCDFKLLLIINGQQTASSTFPCPYCTISLQELRNFHEINDNESKPLKTYKDLNDDYANYVSAGKKKEKAKFSHSVVNEPIFRENDNITVLEKCYVPELHLLQGFVNHLFWKGLVPLVGREKALIWPLKLKLISNNYHGETFEGNACRKLLKEADALSDKKIYETVGPLALVPYICAFKAMDKMVHSCFSTERRGSADELTKVITELQKAILSTKVSVTLKLHVIFEHVEQTLKLLRNFEGLGKWSEQAGESVHREFLNFWEKYKINLINDSSYSGRLKAATVQFSSFHI